MGNYTVGYLIGSLSVDSINRMLSKALIRLAPDYLAFQEISIRDLPLYNRDLDDDYPPAGRALKDAIAAVDAVLFVTPEYNRGVPGVLKNAIDWASRPHGTNSFAHKPSAVIGASSSGRRSMTTQSRANSCTPRAAACPTRPNPTTMTWSYAYRPRGIDLTHRLDHVVENRPFLL